MDLAKKIIDCFDKNVLTKFDIKVENFSTPPNSNLGDYCLACFSYSKLYKKAPQLIVEEMLENFNYNSIVEATKFVGGYLNFFLNKAEVSKLIVNEILTKKENFGSSDEGKGKTVCIDFSSINLAKYMHIGHLSTTIIGNVLRNIYNFLGYKTVAINYVGDYGTPFGKMVKAYMLWGNEESLSNGGVDYTQDLYIKFCQEAETHPELEEAAREIFAKIENRDKEIYPIYEKLIGTSKQEAQKIYDLLNISFDSWRGESYYIDKMSPIVNELTENKMLQESEGARVVDLTNYNLGYCLITKSDGSSLYSTRDLAACEDRFNTYHFDKSIYVTDVSQKLHFSQFFKILELLNKPYAKDLVHVYYGRFSLPNGKIASRKGKQALLRDILQYSITKTSQIVSQNNNLTQDEKDKISKSVGVGAVVFSAVKNEKIKDVVFDIDEALDFEGETSPYIQYTCARCCSILNKTHALPKDFVIDYSQINNDSSFELLKSLNKFSLAVRIAKEKFEPCFISRILIDISKAFNKYYNNNRVIDEGKTNDSRLALVLATKIVLKQGLKLLGIDALDKM